MLPFLFPLLSLTSRLEQCVFDEGNIEKALTLEPMESVDYALKYFILKRFKNEHEKASLLLLDAPENNVFCNLILVRSNDDESHLDIPIAAKNLILKEFGAVIADLFLKNKYQFRDLINLERIVSQREIRDVLKNVWFGDPWIISKFFVYIETRDIRLENVVKEMKYLSKQRVKQANYFLGLMYLSGIGVEKDSDKALEYFWSSGFEEFPQAYVGIAKVYMEEGHNPMNAINNLQLALKSGPNPEASYCLYRISRIVRRNGELKDDILKTAAYAGYLPAVYEYGAQLSDQGILDAANVSLNSVMVFHPEVLKYDALAYQCFLAGNYKKALMIYLFLSEFELSYPIKNSIYLLEKYRLIENQDSIMYDIYKKLARTDSKYNMNVGNYYFAGIGVEQSYLSAFASYLASRKFSEEGAYNTATMYEHGLGVSRNLYEAKRIIKKYVYRDSSYLVRFYSLLRINLKILIYHHYVVSTMVTLASVLGSSILLKKGIWPLRPL